MIARDLTRSAPRRWNVQTEGIPWLPRLIDKAKAYRAGTLGTYLYGQSPMDRSLLHVLGVGHRAFADIVDGCTNDNEVVAALAARDAEAPERARAWGKRFTWRHRIFFALLDIDDGYAGGALRRVKPAANVVANGLTAAIKRVWPYHG